MQLVQLRKQLLNCSLLINLNLNTHMCWWLLFGQCTQSNSRCSEVILVTPKVMSAQMKPQTSYNRNKLFPLTLNSILTFDPQNSYHKRMAFVSCPEFVAVPSSAMVAGMPLTSLRRDLLSLDLSFIHTSKPQAHICLRPFALPLPVLEFSPCIPLARSV